MPVALPNTGVYHAKDQAKANKTNKFIGRGSLPSSTNAYAKAYGALANCGVYEPTDVVFISAEGNRRGRLDPDFDEINLAASYGVTFITDIDQARDRDYNIGERQVAAHLERIGYVEVSPGTWKEI